MLEVSFNCQDADVEFVGDLGVAVPLGSKTRDIHFAWGECVPLPTSLLGLRWRVTDEVNAKRF